MGVRVLGPLARWVGGFALVLDISIRITIASRTRMAISINIHTVEFNIALNLDIIII